MYGLLRCHPKYHFAHQSSLPFQYSTLPLPILPSSVFLLACCPCRCLHEVSVPHDLPWILAPVTVHFTVSLLPADNPQTPTRRRLAPPDPRQPVSLSGDREPPPLSKILLATSVAASPQFRTYSRPVSSISSGNPLDYSHCTGAPLLQPWASDGGCKSATLLPDWQNRLWVHFWPFSTWSALHIVSPGYSTVCTADTCLDLLLSPTQMRLLWNVLGHLPPSCPHWVPLPLAITWPRYLLSLIHS